MSSLAMANNANLTEFKLAGKTNTFISLSIRAHFRSSVTMVEGAPHQGLFSFRTKLKDGSGTINCGDEVPGKMQYANAEISYLESLCEVRLFDSETKLSNEKKWYILRRCPKNYYYAYIVDGPRSKIAEGATPDAILKREQ